MPNCFCLTPKGEAEPASLNYIDALLCQRLDLPYSERSYTYGWYDDIGFALACGKSFEQIIDINRAYLAKEPFSSYHEHELTMIRIAAHLNEHFVANAWAEIGRR